MADEAAVIWDLTVDERSASRAQWPGAGSWQESSIPPQGCLFLAAVGFPSSSNLRDQGRKDNTFHDLISEVTYHHLCHNLFFSHISALIYGRLHKGMNTRKQESSRKVLEAVYHSISSRSFLDSLAPYTPLFPILNSSNSLKIRAPGDCPIKSH